MEYKNLITYLKANNVTEDDALLYIKQSLPPKRHWKMMRFTLYLWKRIEEHNKGRKRSRIATVIYLVSSPKYKRLYDTFPGQPKFNSEREAKNLSQLIAEPRQDKEFKSKNFVYEGTKRNIPQEVINRLR